MTLLDGHTLTLLGAYVFFVLCFAALWGFVGLLAWREARREHRS